VVDRQVTRSLPIGSPSSSTQKAGIDMKNHYQSLLMLAAAMAAPVCAQTIDKAFSAPPILGIPSIALNHTTTLTFTITADAGGLTAPFGFTDPLAGGLVATAVLPSSTCPDALTGGATLAIAYNASSSGLGANQSCTVSFTVKGTFPGLKINLVQGTGSLAGIANQAQLSVVSPQFSKAFSGPIVTPPFPTIPLNGTTTITFTVKNVTPEDLTSVG